MVSDCPEWTLIGGSLVKTNLKENHLKTGWRISVYNLITEEYGHMARVNQPYMNIYLEMGVKTQGFLLKPKARPSFMPQVQKTLLSDNGLSMYLSSGSTLSEPSPGR